MQGFLKGLLLGTVAVAAAAVVISFMAPPPSGPAIATGTAAVTAPAQTDDQGSGTASGRDGDVVEIAPTPPASEPGSDDLAVLQDSDTLPAARPTVSGDTDPLAEPGAGGSSPESVPAPTGEPPAIASDSAGSAPSDPGAADNGPVAEAAPERPTVGEATAGLDVPTASGSAPDVSAIAASPATPNPSGDSGGNSGGGSRGKSGGRLSAPEAESGSISVDPAQPAPPSVGGDTADLATAPKSGTAPEVTAASDPAVSGEGSTAMTPPDRQDAPATAAAPGPDPSAEAATPEVPVQPPVDAQEETPVVVGQEDPAVAPSTPAPAPTQPAPAPAQPPTPDAAEPPAPRIAALPQTGAETGQDTGPKIGTRVRPLTERGDKNAFLPGTGADSESGSGAGSAAADEQANKEPPIRRYSASFDNPEAKPLMSIVLIDDEQSIGVEALQEFPYPLTFAVSPSDPRAIEKLARHRAAGFEVALLTDLPSAANAQDAEVSLDAALSALPETVAILEGTGSGIQGNRQLSDQVAAIALGTGRGLVTQRNGLNTVQKLAARKGVPSAVIFRDFDGAGQSPDTIRRFLDQAAFRADQEGAVVMLGRVRPDTISALLLWGLQDRASRVALAPLSATLLREPAE